MTQVIIKKKKTDDSYLAHYGVKGMKWGFKKGTLSLSTQNKIGSKYTDRQKRGMTRQAERILNKNIKKINRKVNAYSKATEHQTKRGNKTKSDKYRTMAEQYIKRSAIMNTQLTNIKTGTCKAGEDFVTNTAIEGGWRVLADTHGVFDRRVRQSIEFRE